MVKVKFKKLHQNAKLPTYAKPGDAGMDLYACLNMVLGLGETPSEEVVWYLSQGNRILIPTGLSMELPLGYEAQIRPRSGLALKEGITVLNSPGTIDAAYRGAVGIILINHTNIVNSRMENTFLKSFKIKNGMKIAQMVIKKVEQAEIEEVDELSDSERGSDGFGSTGL